MDGKSEGGGKGGLEGGAVEEPGGITDEGDDAGSLAVLAHLLADGAEVAPIGPDAAALGGEPDVLVPQADDAFEAVEAGVAREPYARKRDRNTGTTCMSNI